MNLLDNTSTEPSKFRTKVWVEVNNDRCKSYGAGYESNSKLQC